MSRDLQADIVIVGSGPVGSSFARTIANLDPALGIVMIEGGPQITSPVGRHVKTIVDEDERILAQVASQGPAQYVYDTAASQPLRSGEPGERPVTARPGTFLLGDTSVQPGEDGMPAAAMSSNVGGMGAHWTCAAPVPGDGERVEFIDRADFDDAFAESWRLLHVTQHAFDGAPLGQEVRDLLAAEFDQDRADDRRVQPMPLGITIDGAGDRYWTGPDVILGDLPDSDAFTLLPDTLARRVLTSDGIATGVEVEDRRTGEIYRIDGRAVVVAADSFRTPQLLFASGIRPRALGHYLNDHPQVIAVTRLSDDLVPESARVPRGPGKVDPLSGVNWIPYDRDRLPFHFQVMQLDASPIPLEGVEEPWPGSIVGVGTFGVKDIQFSDRVEFSDSETDSFGMPLMRVHYTLTEKDHANYRLAIEKITRIAQILGELVGGNPPAILPSGSSLHYMGTTRMGARDDGDSVCDHESRVWGFQNLYIGGNGVIPTGIACNPTATSVALAVRAARALVRDLTEENTHAS